MPKLWFGRRQKPAKLKEGRSTASTAVTEGNQPVAASELGPQNNDALRKTPSRRSSRRKRTASRSTASMRDLDKSSPILSPPNPPFARHPHSHHNRRDQGSVEDITALPFSKRLEQSPHLRPITGDHGKPYNFQVDSQASLPTPRERGKLQRPQSLRKSVNESTLVRRKSSRKKPHDSVREEEIRAMSMPLPQKRPAGNSGGMLRRDSKKVKGAYNRHFERPTSNISLPLEESIHSSMSGNSETRAWRVSALDMFSPRPTVRCSVGSQYYYNNTGAGPSPTSDKGKNDARKDLRYLASSRDGKEERRSNRIDDLADTLDAGALREILERDKRRRDKKRKQDDERLRRRLEKRAEKQRLAEQNGQAAAHATPRETNGNAAVGLGIERNTHTNTHMPMEGVRPTTPPQAEHGRLERLDTGALAPSYHEHSQLPTPLETPIVADAEAIRYSRASMSSPTPHGHARESSNVSQMPDLLSEMIARETPAQSVEQVHDVNSNASGTLHAIDTTDTTATGMATGIGRSNSRRASFGAWARRRSSEGRHMGVFAALFRRGKRNSQDHGRTTPSEVSFSNTSRESMSRQPRPAHLVAPALSSQYSQSSQSSQPVQIRRPSSVPRRTMSKFREDLPEFPLSPPDSRVQSPEITSTAASAIATRRRSQQPSDLRVGAESPATVGRTDSPVSPGVPPTNLMSQSLASVDSEGSWLSGKPIQRRSNKSHLRSSVGSMSAIKRTEEFNNSYEELGIPDDEYFRRLTPQPDELGRISSPTDQLARKASSTAMAAFEGGELDQEHEGAMNSLESPDATRTTDAIAERRSEEEERVQSSVGRQPTIVHRQPRVKSTEGLLSYFEADRPSPEEKSADVDAVAGDQESPMSETGSVMLQRARSVDLGKHHSRQLSAGSAKLLSISAKRSSVDPKRASLSSQTVQSQE